MMRCLCLMWFWKGYSENDVIGLLYRAAHKSLYMRMILF